MSKGRIVSKSKHFTAKKEMRLLKYGYDTKKGKFGYVKINKTRHNKKMRGGHVNIGSSLSSSGIDGQGITNYGLSGSVGIQEAAGMAGGKHRRKMHGGSGMKSMSEVGSSNWSGDGIAGAGITVGNAGSANLQLLAGMAGGKKRKLHKRKNSMYGGTTKPFPPQSMGNPLNAALNAA